MSGATSPRKFSGGSSYDHFYENDISSKMKVPKRIRVTGDNDEDPTVNWARYNGINDKLQMNVPDRILVAGGEQHIGTRGVPREFELEQQIMPEPDPTLYRVQTPPRTITLDSYSYPAADDVSSIDDKETVPSTPGDAPTIMPRNSNSFIHPVKDIATPGMMTDLSPSEEMQLLRRRVERLNRRVMALELDSQQRANREMIMYSLGVAYFLIKTLFWLNKN